MKTKIAILAIIGIAISSINYAQIVTINENNRIVIDCSNLKAESYTTTPKKRTTTATDFTQGANPLNDISSDESNEKIFKKFEISNTNIVKKTWKEAIDYCYTKNDEGSVNWRIPTYREIVLIGILLPEIDNVGAGKMTNIVRAGHWCATEIGSEQAFGVAYTTPMTIGSSDKVRYTAQEKKELGRPEPWVDDVWNYIRCIRDLN